MISKLLTADIPGHFLRRALAIPGLFRLTLVSPWISLTSGGDVSLAHALPSLGDSARVILITRPPAALYPWHLDAITAIAALDRGKVYLHNTLHAKFFVAEGSKGSYAVLGSANMTAQGSVAREVGVAISGRSWGEGLVRELLLLAQELRHDESASTWKRGV